MTNSYVQAEGVLDFKPTYLYIKQHRITGKLYFGKTIKTGKNFERYAGSGKHWVSHIKKHGKEEVETIWYCLFYNKEDLKEFALSYSNINDIVNSSDWLNLKLENGLDGGPLSEQEKKRLSDAWKGERNPNFKRVFTEEEKILCGKGNRGKPRTEAVKNKISKSVSGVNNPFYGKSHTEETKLTLSLKLAGENSPNYGRIHTDEFKENISNRMAGEGNHRYNTGAKFDVITPDGKILLGLTTAELSSNFGFRNWSTMFKNSKRGIVCGVKLLKVHK